MRGVGMFQAPREAQRPAPPFPSRPLSALCSAQPSHPQASRQPALSARAPGKVVSCAAWKRAHVCACM